MTESERELELELLIELWICFEVYTIEHLSQFIFAEWQGRLYVVCIVILCID